MKKILKIIKANKKRLTYIRDINQSITYQLKKENKREVFVRKNSITSLAVYFQGVKGLNRFERGYFNSQRI